MGDGLGEVAKSWLADPPWQKVFKHTFDVIEDYVNYILVSDAFIYLSNEGHFQNQTNKE